MPSGKIGHHPPPWLEAIAFLVASFVRLFVVLVRWRNGEYVMMWSFL
jgi:hypothetical protein